VARRPIVRNRSMSNRTKIELIARLLYANAHDVEVFSHGEVIENRLRFYPGFSEPERFHAKIPVHYISALPIRRLNGMWSSFRMVQLFRQRHAVSPFDLVILFNLKRPQLACARDAVRHGVPTILEYEDDVFRNVGGEIPRGLVARYHRRWYRRALTSVSGCIAVSPHLLSQVADGIPKMLLRGVVGEDILEASELQKESKRNIVLFSGTHTKSNGIEELLAAWGGLANSGWELHITGYGEMSDKLRRMAEQTPAVVFHGLVSREKLVSLMCSAKICINPHSVSQTPGNVFAFKIIEYLAAGAHVATTRMGALEPEIEKGITYMRDNRPNTIAAALQSIIRDRLYDSDTRAPVHEAYGPSAVARELDMLVREVCAPSHAAYR